MIKIYESFSDFAKDFVDGESRSHRLSDHTRDECCGWQKGVKEFAQWLDDAGGELLCKKGIWEKLWDAWGKTQAADHEHPDKEGPVGGASE